jgi:hypothetical protein
LTYEQQATLAREQAKRWIDMRLTNIKDPAEQEVFLLDAIDFLRSGTDPDKLAELDRRMGCKPPPPWGK